MCYRQTDRQNFEDNNQEPYERGFFLLGGRVKSKFLS